MSRLPRFPGLSLALLGFLAAVTPSLAQNAKLDAALSNSWWGHVPIMVAVDKGYFKELGIEVEVKHIAASSDRTRAVTSGAAAFSNLGRIAVISEMANDNKTFYFFANVDDSPGNEGCRARPGFASSPSDDDGPGSSRLTSAIVSRKSSGAAVRASTAILA